MSRLPGSARALLRGASLLACLAGATLVARGGAVPVRAEIAQIGLERSFEQRLALHIAQPAAKYAAVETVGLPLTVRAKVKADAKARPLPTDGPIARISVERLGIRDVVLAGAPTHDRLASGPTMLKRGDTASPVTVLAAHRDTHFLFIRDLNVGDTVTMENIDGTVERYRVTHFETVRWNAFAYPLDPPRPLLALTTCYPFGGMEYGGPWRRVAWAEKVA